MAEHTFWLSCSSTLFSAPIDAAHFFDAAPDSSGQLKKSDSRPITGIGVKARRWLMDIGDPGAAPVDRQLAVELLRGHYLIETTTYGTIAGFTTGEGIKLAQLVDRRIQQSKTNLE